nr:putative transposase En/Spm [Ipomoea batatas]
MGKRKTRYLSAEERFAAHQYVLLNCEEVQPILRPITEVSTYTGYVVNGFKFQTEEHCRRKSTSNYGVSIKGTASPNNALSPPTSPRNRPTIHPIGNKSFEPCLANREVIECVTKIFPDAIKSYSDAPRHMKDVWFNEFRVRKQLAKGEGHPKWMSDPVLAQYLSIWNQENFKKLAEKNKKIEIRIVGNWDHRCTLQKEKLGEQPSHATLFQATHKRKKTDSFVCKKAQQVMEAATQIQQTQPELGDSNVWYEAAGGLKKGGYVFGFGSDTPHYFPEVVSQRNSKSGQSSSHAACDKKLDELKDQVAWLVAEVAALREPFGAATGGQQPPVQLSFAAADAQGSVIEEIQHFWNEAERVASLFDNQVGVQPQHEEIIVQLSQKLT